MDAKDLNQSIKLACSLMGGLTSLARAIGVTPPTVHQWITGARPIPLRRCMDIERITDGSVTCEQLRPDVSWISRGSSEERAA